MVVTKVGFVGLGSMGRTIALNVLRRGFDLMVFDIDGERLEEFAALGARIGRSTDEVAAHGEVVEIVVVDDAQVEAVVLGENGILGAAKPGTIIAIHSTIHPDTVRRLAAVAASKGIGVIDAQVSGDASGAETKILCFMVGGDKALVEKCAPVLSACGGTVFHVGELGMGAATKLAHQALVMGTLASVAEAMLLAKGAGIEPELFERVVRTSAAQSYIAEHWLDLFSRFDKKNAGTITKSVIPALEMADQLGLSLPLTALARQLVPAYILGSDPFVFTPKGRTGAGARSG